MYPVEGGNFSSDQLAQILARLNKGSMSEDQLQQAERIPQEAINQGIGTAGTIRNVGAGIKLIPSEFDLEQEAFKKAVQNVPSFWEKYGPKPVNVQNEQVDPEKFKNIIDLFKK